MSHVADFQNPRSASPRHTSTTEASNHAYSKDKPEPAQTQGKQCATYSAAPYCDGSQQFRYGSSIIDGEHRNRGRRSFEALIRSNYTQCTEETNLTFQCNRHENNHLPLGAYTITVELPATGISLPSIWTTPACSREQPRSPGCWAHLMYTKHPDTSLPNPVRKGKNGPTSRILPASAFKKNTRQYKNTRDIFLGKSQVAIPHHRASYPNLNLTLLLDQLQIIEDPKSGDTFAST
ncbi:hypothetical protein BKA65DRAFT_482825 [Rhexocercosporidium sp. MPI-PUGE-AT-0058]|nr:hypothetical protein BKA65DRAFT_482825 [Rhexocercosporidium sp. MPI-PUGE-AT-0058]